MLSLTTTKNLSASLLICALLGSSTSATPTPRDQGAAAISGRVSRSVTLSLVQAWQQQFGINGISVNAESIGLDSVQVVLSGVGSTASGKLTIPLEIRTNTAYEMRIVLLSMEGCSPAVDCSIESVRASGTWVAPGAVNGARSESLPVTTCSNPTTCLHGPRVSTGGNFESARNALIAELALSIPVSAQQCSWRIAFRVSLQPTI